jgi:hypothetical protein
MRTGFNSIPSRGTALPLIDVINDLQFPSADALIAAAEMMAPRLARLATQSDQEGNQAHGGKARADQHRQRQTLCAPEQGRTVQGVGRRRKVTRCGSSQEGQDEGEEWPGR